MYLYDYNNGDILVYRMQPNLEKISEYRKDQTIYNGIIFEVNTNDKKAPFNFEELKTRPFTDFSLDDVCYKRLGIPFSYHNIVEIDYDNNPPCYSIEPLRSYWDGGYDEAALVRIYNKNDKIKQLEFVRHLLINDDYDYVYDSEKSREKCIDKIVGITEEAFILELLKRGHFSSIGSADISEQICLFDFSKNPITTISAEQFSLWECAGITERRENAYKKVDDSQKILKYARGQGLIK